jgi:hypothetical protein
MVCLSPAGRSRPTYGGRVGGSNPPLPWRERPAKAKPRPGEGEQPASPLAGEAGQPTGWPGEGANLSFLRKQEPRKK